MSKELKVEIGGVGISIKWNGLQVKDLANKQYSAFISDCKTEVTLTIHVGNLPVCPLDEIIFNADGSWKLYQSGSRYIIERFSPSTHEKETVAIMQPDFTSGNVYTRPKSDRRRQDAISQGPLSVCQTKLISGKSPLVNCQPTIESQQFLAWSFPTMIRSFGEILMMNLLARGRGIMVHGLGINDGGKGLVFVGSSGSGKTTLARLWYGQGDVTVLNDDRIIVRKIKDQFWVYGTPWHGEFRVTSPQAVPIDKIFFIRHSLKNTISPQTGTLAFKNLFPQIFPCSWNRPGMEFVLQFCEELICAVPCCKLGFIDDKRIVDFVRNLR